MQISEQKKALRTKCKEKRKNEVQKEEKDRLILNSFKSSDVYKNNDVFFVYVSTKIEVGTHELIRQMLSDGKKVACPVSNTADCSMEFYYISSFDDLKVGAYNILEPDAKLCKKAEPKDGQVCVVPGLAFDKTGARLGFGKGYYDRFLCKSKMQRCALCFQNCIEQKVPCDEFDIKVDFIFTEEKIYKC